MFTPMAEKQRAASDSVPFWPSPETFEMKLVQYAIWLVLIAVLARLFGWNRTASVAAATGGIIFIVFVILYLFTLARTKEHR
jgi:uncharacterized membrane protein YtjA (UPF0391 family)